MRIRRISPTFFGAGSIVGGGERYSLESAKAIASRADVVFLSFNVSPGSYNVGGANHQISDVANRIGEHVDCVVVAYKELQDRRTYFVSSDLAERELGIRFKWDLDTGIKEVRDVLVKHSHLDYKDPMFSNAAWLGKK